MALETVRRVLPGGLQPLALAGWYTLHLAVLLAFAVLIYPQADGHGGVAYPSIATAFGHLRELVPLALPQQPGLFLLAALLGMLLLFQAVAVLLAWLLRALALVELHEAAAAALCWGVRRSVVPGGLVLVSGVAVAGAVEWLPLALASYLAVPTVLLALLACLALPILLLDRRQLVADRPGAWQRGNWPGWQPWMMFCGGMVLLVLLGAGIERLIEDLRGWLRWPLWLGWQALDLLAFAVLVSMMVYRIRWDGLAQELRGRVRLRFWLAWLLLDLRLLQLALWAVPPLLAASFLATYVVPQYEATLASLGTEPGPWTAVAIALLRAFLAHGMLVLALPLWVLVLLASGRYLLLHDRLEPAATTHGRTT